MRYLLIALALAALVAGTTDQAGRAEKGEVVMSNDGPNPPPPPPPK